ncbi:hydrolase of X-linked nucleoside pyrophosphate N-terminal domain protein [Haemophilus pittmaniae HK 85]|uniref:Hydrolase of X-linked nucleoside pyrophosphate N-terminal domain protein n=1 Tax=Haemophilus pittmaniae HK 85 TaxID=1035188 RepID=F9Q6C7_9PAST|nr:hydrolase of X-linked nucleoside pyrophosphate N-terminal domain protein [Haemophilus pittmaniae HK 85]
MQTQSDSLLTEPWLSWAIEIQSIAQNGLAYCKNIYDIERYERLRDLSAEMLAYKTAIPKETVKSLFCNEAGYQPPKIDSRAAIFQDDKILLVQENDGLWSLPGGWIDVLETIHSNTIKEVREEAGLDVKPTFIIAIHEQRKRNLPPFAHPVLKTFVMCEPLGGKFQPNSETVQSAYFALNELPPMNKEKTPLHRLNFAFKHTIVVNGLHNLIRKYHVTFNPRRPTFSRSTKASRHALHCS